MIESEILKEKCRVQKRLAEESRSVSAYLEQAHSKAEQIARSRGLTLRYVQMPHKQVGVTNTD